MQRRRGARVLVGLSAIAVLAGACSSSDGSIATDATLKQDRGTTTTAEGSSTSGSAPVTSGGSETTTSGTGPDQTASTAAAASELSLDDTVPSAVASLKDYWGRTYPTVIGGPYTPIADDHVIAVHSLNPRLTCGGEVINEMILAAGGNALYCSDGDYIAYDARTLIPTLYRRIGDMAVLVAIAHEWGHSISERAKFVSRTTIGSEQQADCFAGSWAGDVNAGTNSVLKLSPGDLDEALAGLLKFRDPPQVDPRSEGAHGSAFQRIDAFRKGFEGGAAACTELHKQAPLDQGTDTETNDLSVSDLVPLTTQALDLFWTKALGTLGGGPYATFTVKSFRGSTNAPTCSGLTADQVVGHVVYCPSGDFVSWDEDTLDALEDQGDFAVATAIADAWSAGILHRLSAAGDPRTLGLDADCLAGAWAGALARQQVVDPSTNTAVLVLSAGDLDEGVAGFLLESGTAGANASFDTQSTAAFDRTAAFQKGFEHDAKTCVS